MTGPSAGRAQSGLDRLLLFVVVVVALVFVAPHVLGLAGIDVRSDVGAPPAESNHDLTILAARGEAIADDRDSIGAVRLVVVANHDRTPVDLRDGTAIWVDDESHHIAPRSARSDGVDGTYTGEVIGRGTPVLERPTDRGVLQFDLGTDDLDDADEFGRRLDAGETATVTLVTPHGETLTRRLTVPDPIPSDAEEVWL